MARVGKWASAEARQAARQEAAAAREERRLDRLEREKERELRFQQEVQRARGERAQRVSKVSIYRKLTGKQRLPGRPPAEVTLEAYWDQLIEAIITTKTMKEAAAKVGLTPQTIARYLRHPEFAAAVNAARTMALAQAMLTAQMEMPNSIQKMRELRDDERVSPAVRLEAAKEIMRVGQDYQEREEARERDARRLEELKATRHAILTGQYAELGEGDAADGDAGPDSREGVEAPGEGSGGAHPEGEAGPEE